MTDSRQVLCDQQARIRAIDPKRSLIIQAPAGSGKTQVLITRLLALLLTCDQPEQILCVTFTKKACSEMRQRLSQALACIDQPEPEAQHLKKPWQLAQQLATHARVKHWVLPSLTQQLTIETMDAAFKQMLKLAPSPYQSWANYDIHADPQSLYRDCLALFFSHIEALPDCKTAYLALLKHCDYQQQRLESLLIECLASREQWLPALIPSRSHDFIAHMHQQLKAYHLHLISKLLDKHLLQWQSFFDQTKHHRQLLMAHDFNATDFLALNSEFNPANSQPEFWIAWSQWLLSKEGKPRKRFTTVHGKIAKSQLKQICANQAAEVQQSFDAMLACATQLLNQPLILATLTQIQHTPWFDDPETEWSTLKPLGILLPTLVAVTHQHMQSIECTDFAGISIQLDAALKDSSPDNGLKFRLYQQYRHLLIDEYQDTSQHQFNCFEQIVSEWQPESDSQRSVTLVGDPMQSIYRFRQAEVSLFTQAQTDGLGSVKLEPCFLSSNYRSAATLVEWNNQVFSNLDEDRGLFSHSQSHHQSTKASVQWLNTSDEMSENQAICHHIKDYQRQYPTNSIAILVRSRSYLGKLLTLLEQHNIAYQAESIDTLADKAIGLDLITCCELTDINNRLAWLALLRSPPLGFTMEEIVTLIQHHETIWDAIQNPPPSLTASVLERLQWLRPIMINHLCAGQAKHPIFWARELWLMLGYSKFIKPSLIDACEKFWAQAFTLYQQQKRFHKPSAINLLKNIAYTPRPQTDQSNQLVSVMTVHKAKGLEFDCVIIPRLHKRSRGDQKQLLSMHQENFDQTKALWLHSPSLLKSKTSPMMNFLQQKNRQKSEEEKLRVCYVAMTRAKQHMLLTATSSKPEQPKQGWLKLLEPYLQSLNQPSIKHLTTDGQFNSDKSQSLTDTVQDPLVLYRFPTQPVVNFIASPGYSLPDHNVSTGSQIGLLIHRLMQVIQLYGLSILAPEQSTVLSTLAKKLASDLCFDTSIALGSVLERLLSELRPMIQDHSAQWIFDKNHIQIKVEQSIHCQKTKKTHRIDRIFFDVKTKQRWLIDFKSDKPNHDGSIPYNHQAQLNRYLALLKDVYPNEAVLSALYYPLCQKFIAHCPKHCSAEISPA